MAHRLTLLLVCLCGLTLNQVCDGQQESSSFENEIQPLLSTRCGKCHSNTVRKGSLDLPSLEGLVAGGESEEALVAENVDESLLWTIVESGEMPPEGEIGLTERRTQPDPRLGGIRRRIASATAKT